MNCALATPPADGISVDLQWYALKVWVRSEALAATALSNSGYEVFAPQYRERRRSSNNRMRIVNTAAFPGYIFCHFNESQKVPVLRMPAVESIVGFGGKPVAIADSEIEAVRRMLEAGAHPVPYLQLGEHVIIEDGPLAGLEGILTRINGQTSVTVSVHLLQRSVAVQITPDQISPVRAFLRKIA